MWLDFPYLSGFVPTKVVFMNTIVLCSSCEFPVDEYLPVVYGDEFLSIVV